MGLQTPLSKVLGLGSAKEGTEHWWAQRLTAVALVILGIWFAAALVAGLGSGTDQWSQAAVRRWLAQPINSVLMILLIVSGLYHALLGLQVVIEDYVHQHAVKIFALVACRFIHIALAVAAVFSVVRISLGAA